jgi:hypothetical protein
VRGTRISSSHDAPANVVTEQVKVTQHDVEPKGQVSGDVLKQDMSGAQGRDRGDYVGPEVPRVIGPASLSCVGERLARVAGRDPVDRLDLGPVGRLHVAVVRDIGVAVGEDRRGVLVVLDVPGGADVAAEGEGEAHLEAAHS